MGSEGGAGGTGERGGGGVHRGDIGDGETGRYSSVNHIVTH